eukprot:GGOE01041427.1.p1 GENE.GGOE01041427.1~~GGOE01041427.1.p1  ORF type:complete len:233 (-),score=83.22 GGOE01041427.1:190-822(-)
MAGKQLVAFYDGESRQYRALLDEVQYQVPAFLKAQAHRFRPGVHVLDIGCADGMVGETVNAAMPEGCACFHGIDVSRKMVEVCGLHPCYASAHHADLSYGLPMDLQTGDFHAVTAFGCLEFIADHDRLFDGLCQALRPTGLLLCSLELSMLESDVVMFGRRKTLHTEDSAQQLLDRHGLTVLHSEIQPAAYLYDGIPIPYCLVVAQKSDA